MIDPVAPVPLVEYPPPGILQFLIGVPCCLLFHSAWEPAGAVSTVAACGVSVIVALDGVGTMGTVATVATVGTVGTVATVGTMPGQFGFQKTAELVFNPAVTVVG